MISKQEMRKMFLPRASEKLIPERFEDAVMDLVDCVNDAMEERDKAVEELNAYAKDEEIKSLKKEIFDAKRYSFYIGEKEWFKIEDWKREHIKAKHWNKEKDAPEYSGAIGDGFTYEITPTSIGYGVYVKCYCGYCYNTFIG